MKKLNQLILLITTICSLNASAQVVPSYVPTTGLVGWWPFNGNANDESGSGNNGTVNGATLTQDRFGNTNKAYRFDGINDYVEIANNTSLEPNSSISISAWVFIDPSTTTNFAAIISKEAGIPSGYVSYALITGNAGLGQLGDIGLQVTTNNGGYAWTGVTGTSFLNQWVFVTGVYDGSNMKIYHNGSLTSISPKIGNLQYQNYLLTIGRCMANSTSVYGFFKGNIDDIGIWNRALTACEIKKLYNSGSGLTLSTSSSTICLGESKVLSASGATNYLWSNGATTSSITVTPTVTSVYTVTTTYSVGCTDMRTVNVTVNPCTGITEYDDTQLLSIFPNPAKTQININTDINYTCLTIVNSIGQVMIKNEKTNVLSIESLNHGVYFIQLLDKENKLLATKKFIKE